MKIKTLSANLSQRMRATGDRFLRLGEEGQTESEAARIRAIRLATVLRNTPWMMAANVGNAIVTLAAFWNSPMFTLVTVWAAFIFALAVLTGITWWRTRNRPQRETASLRGTRHAVIYAAILSGLWAILDAAFYMHADHNQRLVLVALTVGMAGGGGFALATIPPASIIFSVFMGIGSLLAVSSAPQIIGLNLLVLYAIYAVIITRASLALCDSFTHRVRAQIAADEQRDVIGLLLNDFEENASDWLWGTDADHRLRRASPRYYELTGLTEAAAFGRPLWATLPGVDSACPTMRRLNGFGALRHQLESRESFRDFEINIVKDGKPGVWSLSARPVYDSDGNFTGYRGVGRDVTAAQEARRRIEYLARHDALTDLGNRVMMTEDFTRAISRLEGMDERFSVLLLDLDRFKQVNDNHGHGAGDELLKKVAQALKKQTGEFDTIARLGGDEFAIIQSGITDARQSADLAERIIASLSRPFALSSGTARIGVSIGIACAPLDGRQADALMRNADLALYRAKADGRNRYRFFDKSLDSAARRRNLIEQELRNAVAQQALSLQFQPLVDARSGEVVCVEALLRWNHPTLGTISPVEFIPIAEDIGLISDIGAWVIRQGCMEANRWPETVRVAINLSPRQFSTLGLFQTIRMALQETKLPPARLEFEVTESLLLNSNSVVESTLIAVKNLGVRIALDDFGTGYSSLSYLRRYRFDKLKIDRSFISDIEHNANSRAIVDAVIRLGKDLDLTLVAEGVETEGQFNTLRDMGCKELQGYFVARPMDPQSLLDMLSKTTTPEPAGRISA